MNQRPGFLSTSAIISALITSLVIASLAILNGNALFSPGALNAQTGEMRNGVASHAQITDCAACHPGFNPADRMSAHCLACHTEIAAEQDDPARLHGILKETDPASDCRACHSEHKGANARITSFTGSFPHQRLGFALDAHPGQGCEDCHTAEYRQFDAAACLDCHRQANTAFATAHLLSFGTDCLACHDGLDSRGANFNHTLTSFALTGRHLNLICTKCHLNARTLADLQNTPTECHICHAGDEPHEKRFGLDCETCHTSDGWSPAKFDHNLADFKLTGEHIETECAECHLDKQYKETSSACVSCHLENDEHGGELGTDCGLCHTPEGWEPSTFDHNRSVFVLTGAHIDAECVQCHQAGQFKDTPALCGSCHAQEDKHKGQYGNNCGACHSTTAWKPATFDHNLSAFRLTGAHTNLACSRCHNSETFAGTPTFCAGCHRDPAYHSGMFGTNCASCHNVNNWSANYTGSHPSFGDEGGIDHEGAGCRDCHTQSLHEATCLACHDSNNPSDDGGGGDD